MGKPRRVFGGNRRRGGRCTMSCGDAQAGRASATVLQKRIGPGHHATGEAIIFPLASSWKTSEHSEQSGKSADAFRDFGPRMPGRYCRENATIDGGTLDISVDDAAGGAVPCRIHVKDAAGKPIRAPGLPFWRDHFVCPGRAAIDVPEGGALRNRARTRIPSGVGCGSIFPQEARVAVTAVLTRHRRHAV